MNTKEKIILGVAGGLVIAGVALASTGVISFTKNPTEVFQKMAVANAAVTSSHIDLSITGDFKEGSSSESAHVVMNMSGTASKTDASQAADLHFVVAGSSAGTSELSVEGDFKLLDRMFYLRTTKIPPIPFIEPSMIVNKWFSIDPVGMYKEFGDADKATDLERALSSSSKMPEEFNQKSQALAVQEGVISSISAKENEVVSGVATQKYQLTVNTEKIPGFLVKYTELYNSYAPQAGVAPLPAKSMTEEDAAVFKSLKFSPVSVWVGKSDNLPYKVAFTITIDTAASGNAEMASSDVSGTMAVTATMSDYNKKVTIEKPASSTPIQELFTSLMGGM